jgi:hypothetical protein
MRLQDHHLCLIQIAAEVVGESAQSGGRGQLDDSSFGGGPASCITSLRAENVNRLPFRSPEEE